VAFMTPLTARVLTLDRRITQHRKEVGRPRSCETTTSTLIVLPHRCPLTARLFTVQSRYDAIGEPVETGDIAGPMKCSSCS